MEGRTDTFQMWANHIHKKVVHRDNVNKIGWFCKLRLYCAIYQQWIVRSYGQDLKEEACDECTETLCRAVPDTIYRWAS